MKRTEKEGVHHQGKKREKMVEKGREEVGKRMEKEWKNPPPPMKREEKICQKKRNSAVWTKGSFP